MRRSKSEVRPSDLKLAEDEYNKKTEECTLQSQVCLMCSIASVYSHVDSV